MVGLSGGGWSTTVSTAIDTRINHGYSVEGDETWANFYWYARDRLTHIMIPGSFTDCAKFNHSYPAPISGAEPVGAHIPYELKPSRCINDDTVRGHELSPWAVQFIIDDIRRIEAGDRPASSS
jgi:hypothetical protein